MASIENGSDLDTEASLFKTADKLRGNMEPSDYKHAALGLIFRKHIFVGFELKRQALLAEHPEDAGVNSSPIFGQNSGYLSYSQHLLIGFEVLAWTTAGGRPPWAECGCW